MITEENRSYLKLIHTDLLPYPKIDYFLCESSLPPGTKITDKTKLATSNFWSDNLKVQKHKKKAIELYSLIIDGLSEKLNDIHNENHSQLYWERILGIWLWFYISNYLEKYTKLKYSFKENPNLITLGIDPKHINPATCSIDYIDSLRESEIYHIQQYSFILKDFFKTNYREVKLNKANSSKKDIVFQRKNLKDFITNFYHRLIGRGYFSGSTILFATRFSNLNLFKIHIKSLFSITPIFKNWNKKPIIEKDISLRNNLSFNNFQTNNCELAESIIKSLSDTLPTDFIESYSGIKKIISVNIKKNLPKKIVTGVGFVLDSKFSIWAASCGEKGTKIFGCQHGGLYGDTKMIADEFFERKLSDEYITWGWGQESSLLNLPSQIFSKKRISNRNPQKILWVMTLDSRYSYHIEEMLSGCRLQKYFINQELLFDTLSPKVKDELVIRKYPNDFGWKISEMWNKKYGYFNDNNSNSFHDNLKESKLVIIDHIGGTTALECAAESIPFLMISDPRDSEFRKSADDIHKKLINVGLLHLDYKSAAEYINSISSDINGWWLEPERQKVFNDYRDMYVKTDTNFLSNWLNFLK